MKQTIILASRSDRLVARMQLFLYAWRFAEAVDGRLIMTWPEPSQFARKFDGYAYSPALLFDLESFYEAGGSEQLVFLQGNIALPRDKRSLGDPEFEEMRRLGFDRQFFRDNAPLLSEGKPPRYYFTDQEQNFDLMRADVRRLFFSLPRNREVASEIDRALAELGPSFVALHVRRGDVSGMLARDLPSLADGSLSRERLDMIMGHYVARTAPFEFYYPPLEAALADGEKIVFFSDSPETLGHFTDRYGAEHFVPTREIGARLEPTQKAFIDFSLMVTAKRVISTSSSYARFSTELGSGDHYNVAGKGPIEILEAGLYDNFLAGQTLPAEARAMLADSLTMHYATLSHRAKAKANANRGDDA